MKQFSLYTTSKEELGSGVTEHLFSRNLQGSEVGQNKKSTFTMRPNFKRITITLLMSLS